MARAPCDVELCDHGAVLIDEHIRPDGALVRTHLESLGPDRVRLIGDDGVHGELSSTAVERVMLRYGRPLDPAHAPAAGAGGGERDTALSLGAATLSTFRFKAVVDADARDYLVWSAPDAEPLAALATGVAAALRYLVLRIAEERTK
jgi:hypothetical protein